MTRKDYVIIAKWLRGVLKSNHLSHKKLHIDELMSELKIDNQNFDDGKFLDFINKDEPNT